MGNTHSIEKQYAMKEVIQTDGFATVQRAVNRKSSQEFAVRTIAKESPHAANLENEVRVLQRVSHPHIVRLLEVFETAKHVHLVMDRQQGECVCVCVCVLLGSRAAAGAPRVPCSQGQAGHAGRDAVWAAAACARELLFHCAQSWSA
mmetsp:Transcript_19361/g.38317  ORF Transcript_19361/g.38317 Transcript_19361/m.38317 type:complete len:147 (+) Transcript_19361:1442-1882(+)